MAVSCQESQVPASTLCEKFNSFGVMDLRNSTLQPYFMFLCRPGCDFATHPTLRKTLNFHHAIILQSEILIPHRLVSYYSRQIENVVLVSIRTG